MSVELLPRRTEDRELDWLRKIDHELCRHFSFCVIHTISEGKHWRGLSGGFVEPRVAMESDVR